ncbi:Glycosyl hydrolases family 38 N-terminal domain-containing protein [Arenibacter palladensis]|uniref:Glycosyl hydrolases family 38 N-terminal domain-containing protein n=2 Tax=Arenibacter palladensis TaxID=237373 RepID=A0A1M4SVV7_9FLAO|nr:Glycosyl hydrolases family 38 N-terminal domain-containing protein [Arenibacter palladensis]
MEKFRSSLLLLLFMFKSNAQIAAVEVDNGSESNQVTDIVIVFKMHVDIGYTDWAEGVLQKYTGSMLDETLHSLEVTSHLPKEEQFVWTIPGWPLKYMLDNCSADKKAQLEDAVASGRIVPHALPVTSETEASDLENLARRLGTTSQINARFGLPEARDAKLTDVPSHSYVLPTLLKNAGVDFIHFGCNSGSTSPDVPRLFWWQGPDGSKLLTFYWAEYYGSGIMPPNDWPYKTWLAMIHTHENTGAPSPEYVAELLKEAKEKMPNANIKIGRLSDFHDLLMKENPDLPVVKGDMPDSWIHGFMSNPRETKMAKKLHRKAYDTEILSRQMNVWGMSSDSIEGHIKNVTENIMLYDEHTFGAAMSHGNQLGWKYGDEFKLNKSLGHYDYIEETWIEKRNRIHKAEKIVAPLLRKQLKQLAASVNVEGKRIVVYNPLPWERGGRVRFFGGVYGKNFNIYALKDALTEQIIPVYEDGSLFSFDVDAVPAGGYKSFIPITKPIEVEKSVFIDEKNNTLENNFFKLKIDKKKGTLVSLYDKKNKLELVAVHSEYGFGGYFMEQPGFDRISHYNKAYVKPGNEGWANPEMTRPPYAKKGDDVYFGTCEKLTFQNIGNAVRATVWGKLNDSDEQKYLVSYTLYEKQPYVEVNWGVDGKKPNSTPEAGWLSFPFNVENPNYGALRTGGIVDPNTDFVKNTNFDYFFLNTSMALYGKKGNGVALNCPESPAVSIDEPGLWRFTGEKKFRSGNVFVNLYNNQWGTNFTEWIEGSFSSKMYIWGYDKYNSATTLITPTEDTRTPLMGVFFEGQAGEHPLSQEGISINRSGVLLTAFFNNEEGTVLRLWEQAGENGKCTVKLPTNSGFKRAYPSDLRNNTLDGLGIEIVNDSFSIYLKKNQPVTFILK